MNRDQYIERVARLVGFHTPPQEVRERIEWLYMHRFSDLRAADNIREWLQVRRGDEHG